MNRLKYTLTDKSLKLRGQIVTKGKKMFVQVNERNKITQNDIMAEEKYHKIRIHNAYATVAMKNSELTLEQVFDIVNDEYTGLARNEILAVKNAYEAYKQLFYHHFINRISVDPYSIPQMQNIHRAFMAGLSKEAGLFRSDISAEKMQRNVGDLIEWVKESKEPMLIKACVFHYEFISISPFSEGSEYIARMWQMLLVHQKKGDYVYFRVPVLNVLRKRRQEYYDILAIADKAVGCTIFIEFMLQVILDAITEFEKGSSL